MDKANTSTLLWKDETNTEFLQSIAAEGEPDMHITKQLTCLLKAYLEGTTDREALNAELRKLYAGIPINNLYAIIIRHIAIVPEIAYNKNEIRYVYKALMGEEEYTLRYTFWHPIHKNERDANTQKIVAIARNYVNNYESKRQFQVLPNQTSYLEEEEVKFILSLYANMLTRNEFGHAPEMQDAFFGCLLHLLQTGHRCPPHQHYDTNRYVMEKLKYYLSAYDANIPLCCTVLLQNGMPYYHFC